MIAKLIGILKRYSLRLIQEITVFRNRLFLKEILVLGDSHAKVFDHPSFCNSFPGYFFNVISVGGATVSGLKNPNSVSQAKPTFNAALKHTKAEKVFILLGEVDTGFVIWFRAQKYQVPINEMLDQAITNYSQFLMDVAKQIPVVCISTPLPTIQDDNQWGEVANARREVTATQKERTALTLQFNQAMNTFCEKNGLSYILLDSFSIGSNGIVKPELLHKNPANHHYDMDCYADLLIRSIKPLLV